MKHMNRRKIFNCALIIMIALLLAVLAQFFIERAGTAKNAAVPRIVTVSINGQASVRRRGAGYRLKEDIGLVETDSVLTAPGSGASFMIADCGMLLMDENSEITVVKDSEDLVCIGSVYGTALYDINPSSVRFAVECPAGDLSAAGECLFSVETYHGTQTIKVYSGSITLSSAFLETDMVIPGGKQLVITQNDDGASSFEEIRSIPLQSMSGFLIDALLEMQMKSPFSEDALQAELQRREAEVAQAKREQEEYEASVIARGGTVPVVESSKPIPEYMTEADVCTCTITIRCDTVIQNMGDLAEGKSASVPDNGIILDTSRVQFISGETVYDVLKRACAAAGIPLEYSWTVEFGGYYIEGINGLCEFDCGPESGWMYKVNGWFPNYGSSNYILKDGDIIVWEYTCRGLGSDLGLDWEL
ncbi:MAG: DUF4430 domain-containing protein [Eubacteriaceae bacterium]|nr:DUF4430 domain-containing protein [Eubacteriaceae bacterium]